LSKPVLPSNLEETEWVKQLRPLGKLFYKLNLIFYDKLFDDIDFNWKYWHVSDRIICHFKGHNPEQFYRLPKQCEYGNSEMMGCVKAEVRCKRCWQVIHNDE